jgi:hypothetical protein
MRIRTRPALGAVLLAMALFTISEFARAQSSSAKPQPSPAEFSIPLLPPEQMTAGDQAAAQRQQQTIATSAQFYGYTLDSSYAYREIACPVAPDHLLLAYEATSQNGSVSRFTAVVRRGAEEESAGRHPVAEIIPILHFGVVPFGPAIANPHSINVFNSGVANAPSATEVLAATQAGNQPLLVRVLCYLAMVGEEPAALRSPGLEQATIHAPIPTLVFQGRGKIRQMISVRGAASSYQVWALTFQPGGKLLSAIRAEHPIDRTPLVLNAANTASPAEPTTPPTIPTVANSAPSQVSAEPAISTPVTHEPVTSAPAAATTARDESPPTPPASVAPAVTSPLATAETAKPPVLPTPPPPAAALSASALTPASANAEVSRPPSPPSPAENTAPVTEPVTAPVSSPAATAVQPIAPAGRPVAVPPPSATAPPSPSANPTPAASAAAQPPVTPAASAPAAIPAAPVPAASAIVMQPIVKPSPPPPPGRFVPDPPQPPSRFIPDSVLKKPPHLPQ